MTIRGGCGWENDRMSGGNSSQKSTGTRERKGPSVHAGEHKNEEMEGNDGNLWKSLPVTMLGKKVFRWVRQTKRKISLSKMTPKRRMSLAKKSETKQRQGPSEHAGEHKNEEKTGNDRNLWKSLPMTVRGNEVFRWVRQTKKKSSIKRRKTPKSPSKRHH